jgi:HSP20 family protein
MRMARLPVRRGGDEDLPLALWDPFQELHRLSRQMSRLFEEAWLPLGRAYEALSPAADIEETDDAYVIEVELPGVRKGDVSVEATGRRLVVRAERREPERQGILRRRGRATGKFLYEVTFPGEVDPEHIEAKLEDGVLTVRAPKVGQERPRTIPVR